LRNDADAVALKIRSVLPREIGEFVDQLRERTVLDPYWLHAVQEGSSESGRWFKLSEAVARRRKVIMEYFVASRDEVTQRRVDPLGLIYYTDHWNLIAFDHLRSDIRNFRLDRIEELYVLTERFEAHEEFDLATWLEGQGMDSATESIRLKFSNRSFPRARTEIPARILVEEVGDEHTEVTFRFGNLDYLAGWLLRYGSGVQVLAPDPLKERHIAEIGAVLKGYDT